MTDIYEEKIWTRQYPKNYPLGIEVPSLSALDLFENSVRKNPKNPAIHYFDETLSYEGLDDLSNNFAAALSDLGIQKGDRVILQMQNIPQYLIALYGIWKVGGIVVGLNPMYKERELEFYCRDSGAKGIVTMESCFPEVRGLLGRTGLKTVITTSEMDFLSQHSSPPAVLKSSRKEKIEQAIDFQDLLTEFHKKSYVRGDLTPQHIAYLTYTSGTTGPPKGAMNTHGNIVFCAHIYQMACNFGSKDKILGVAPFFHVTGSIGHLATASLAGIPVIAFFRFDPAEVLRLIEKWRATMMIAPLTVYVALLEHPDFQNRDRSSLQVLISGGAPVPSGFVERLEKAGKVYLHNWYGLTETTSPCIITPLGARSPVDPVTGALSVGLPIPNSIVKILDPETGKPAPVGELGEIVAKGPMVVPGYWENPAETEKAIKEGWLFTGDVGKMDAEGWFYIVDRKKDLINVSGYKVWPRDVEDVLYQHPAIKEACVIGVPDAYRGETVKAFVTVSEKYQEKIRAEELIEFCRERMAAYKYPRIVEIVAELPKTLSGKILKRQLRDGEKKS